MRLQAYIQQRDPSRENYSAAECLAKTSDVRENAQFEFKVLVDVTPLEV